MRKLLDWLVRVRYPARQEVLLLSDTSKPGLEPYYSMGTGTLSMAKSGKNGETDYSTAFSAEVKNGWSYTSTPTYASMT
jgi:hypothetical protein